MHGTKHSRYKRAELLEAPLEGRPIIIAVSVVTIILEHFGVLKPFETAALDKFLALKAPTFAQHVQIVEITDEDYEQLFDKTSPLNAKTIEYLIGVVAEFRPAVIGVDIDTSDEKFRRLEISKDWPPIVWGRRVRVIDQMNSLRQDELPHTESLPLLQVGDVLGDGQSSQEVISAAVVLPVDSDKRVRHHKRAVLVTTGEGDPVMMDTFHWSLVKQFCNLKANSSECESVREIIGQGEEKNTGEDLIINSSVDLYSFAPPINAERLLLQTTSDEIEETHKLGDQIRNHIVIIGGTFHQANGEYSTPMGRKYGVELLAQAVESEMTGRGIKPASKYLILSVELLVGIFMVLLNYLFPHRKARLLGFLGLPFLGLFFIIGFALVCSLAVYSTLALWANFVPVMAAVSLHDYYEKRERKREKQREINELRREKESLSKRLAIYEQASATKAPNQASGHKRKKLKPKHSAKNRRPRTKAGHGIKRHKRTR